MDWIPNLLPLWLPIILSAVAVWFISMIFGMALPHHKQDWIGLSNPADPHAAPHAEDGFMDYLRNSGIQPGNYLFPDFRTSAQLKSEKVEKALEHGPVGHLSVWKTPVTMGDKMVGAFVIYLVVSIGIAYLLRVAIPGAAPSPAFARVFQIASAAGILAYSFSFIPNALWFGAYKRTIVASIFDGIICGLVTGAIFAWRWPSM